LKKLLSIRLGLGEVARRISIKISEDVYRKLLSLKRSEDTWNTLLERLSSVRIPSSEEIDRVSWYITKMIISIQSLKCLVDRDSREKQLERTLNVLKQVSERLDIDTSILQDIVKQYSVDPSKENMIIVNEATKEVVKSIIMKTFLPNIS